MATQKDSYEDQEVFRRIKMAIQKDSYEDQEVFRRKVQEKLADQFDPKRLDSPQQETQPKSPFSIQNFIWLGVSVAVFYFSDFLKVILYEQNVNSIWFWIGAIFMSIHISIALFIVLYLTSFKKMDSDVWEKKYPKAIPIATFAFVFGLICLTVGLWPVWGFLTPLILLAIFMGIIIIVAMVG